jgi:ATP/maltotriose-dependent transcriptional regulator MalT
MYLFNDIRAKIPANKFYPPFLDSTQYLPRKRLLQELLQGKGRSSKIILIEAQAGQGKTVLAAQFLERVNAPFAWYQVGAEDGDSVLFLNALLACLMNALPCFRSPLLEEMTLKGEVFPLELPHYANVLLADLDRHLKGDFWLVLDDLHLLERSEASAALLGHILQTAPPKMRFLLTARRPVGLDLPVHK